MKRSLRNIFDARPTLCLPGDFLLLLSFVTRRTKEFLIAHPEYCITAQKYNAFLSLLKRRIKHEPIALITGRKEFYGFTFSVNKATLIPRPETELLVESAIARIIYNDSNERATRTPATIIDVGTGSGNILLSIVKTMEPYIDPKHIRAFGLDTSLDALTIAKRNARILRPRIHTRFLVSDLLIALPQSVMHNSSHLYILANLPYLSQKIYQRCSPDVKNYEPSSALVSTKQGLAHILRLLQTIADIRNQFPSLTLDIWLEISPEQRESLVKKIPNILPGTQSIFQRDLARKNRCVHIYSE